MQKQGSSLHKAVTHHINSGPDRTQPHTHTPPGTSCTQAPATRPAPLTAPHPRRTLPRLETSLEALGEGLVDGVVDVREAGLAFQVSPRRRRRPGTERPGHAAPTP